MKLLILGANGNLGSQISQVFAKSNFDLKAWDLGDFNFLDFELLLKKLNEFKAELIINAAAYNAVDKCETDSLEEKLAFQLNSDLVALLADYALEQGARLVHYSTDYVFGTEERHAKAYRETDAPGPINLYGRSKLAGEKELVRRALKGLEYYLIRTSKIFGPRPNELAKNSFFDLILDISKTKEELELVDDELSAFTYSLDLAKASLELIQSKSPSGIYHIINSGSATWYEGASLMFEILGVNKKLVPISSEKLQRAAKRPKFSVLANTRLRALRSWKEALEEYLKDYKI